MRVRDGRSENSFVSPVQGMGVVIIPFDYEQLPDAQRKKIVPICIASVDRHGNPIARIWFEKGVAPVQDQLRGLAGTDRDVQRVSELAEITVHKLWERHGERRGSGRGAACWCVPCGSAGSRGRRLPVAHQPYRFPAVDSLEGAFTVWSADRSATTRSIRALTTRSDRTPYRGGPSPGDPGVFKMLRQVTPGRKSLSGSVTKSRRHSRSVLAVDEAQLSAKVSTKALHKGRRRMP